MQDNNAKRYLYHFEPKKGWINDPNGLIKYNGKFHVFYQHNPYDTKWGPMHWGHAISDDLIHWEELPVALSPDQDYEDSGGCFSGSAIEKDGKLYLIYTSVSKLYGQTQSVAFSEDGVHFEKYRLNPVIENYPVDEATSDFRDPKVFCYNDEYRLIVGTAYNNRGRLLQYRSQDLLHWVYMGVLYECHEYNAPVECPDLFQLGSRWCLMYSKIAQGSHKVQFILGNYDGKTFIPEEYVSPEGGPDFYAPQSFDAKDGRRIVIGWFYDWSKSVLEQRKNESSIGALTIPREISISKDGILRLFPVREVKEILRKIQISNRSTDLNNVSEINGIEVYVSDKKLSVHIENFTKPLVYHGSINSVELLEDVKGIEIFINHGEANFSVVN